MFHWWKHRKSETITFQNIPYGSALKPIARRIWIGSFTEEVCVECLNEAIRHRVFAQADKALKERKDAQLIAPLEDFLNGKT